MIQWIDVPAVPIRLPEIFYKEKEKALLSDEAGNAFLILRFNFMVKRNTNSFYFVKKLNTVWFKTFSPLEINVDGK